MYSGSTVSPHSIRMVHCLWLSLTSLLLLCWQTSVAQAQNSDASKASIDSSVDERTNALIIRANESQLREIETILLRLDSTEAAARNSGPTVLPSIDANAPGTSIAEYRRRLDALEQPVLQLAEQVRAAESKLGKDHPDFARLRTDLRALIQKTFTARQEIQRAELAEFTRRLQRMQQSIETRERISERIVERRVEELLNRDSALEPRPINTEPREVGPLSDGTVDSFLPWKSPKNAPNLEIAPTAWGEPINGLRLALAVTEGIEAARTKQLHLVVNNVSKTPIQLDNTGWADGFKMAIDVRSNSGEQAETRLTAHDRFFGPSNDSYLLESGETVVLATKQIGLAEDMNSESNTADLLIVGHRPQADADGQQPYYLISTSTNVPGIPGHGAEFRLHTGKVSLEFSARVDSE
jgi:hypothetical protein